MTALLDRYQVYERHPGAYIFWLSQGMLMGQVVVCALIGAMVAIAARGREMTATATLAIVWAVLILSQSLLLVAGNVHFWLGILPWSFAFSIAIVVGGAIVRMRRSVKTARSSAA